jgi:PII-like signaling protein
MAEKHKLVSVYLNEGDEWERRPLHLEILHFLNRSGCAGGTVLRGIAGFTAGVGVTTTSLVDVGNKLPVVVQFIDRPEKVAQILPTLRRMAGRRLVTTEDVEVFPPVSDES